MNIMRTTVLDLSKKIGITDEAHKKLKSLKVKKKESMAQIVINLINNEYDKSNNG